MVKRGEGRGMIMKYLLNNYKGCAIPGMNMDYCRSHSHSWNSCFQLKNGQLTNQNPENLADPRLVKCSLIGLRYLQKPPKK